MIHARKNLKGLDIGGNRISEIYLIQGKPLIMITLGPALFDNNNRLITLSGGYKYLHYLTQFIVTTFYMSREQLASRKACFNSRAKYLGHHYLPIQYNRRISSLDGNEVC